MVLLNLSKDYNDVFGVLKRQSIWELRENSLRQRLILKPRQRFLKIMSKFLSLISLEKLLQIFYNYKFAFNSYKISYQLNLIYSLKFLLISKFLKI